MITFDAKRVDEIHAAVMRLANTAANDHHLTVTELARALHPFEVEKES